MTKADNSTFIRRFVKTTVSDLGYADYSEYFIGHSGSTYWRKRDSEKGDIFRKIEPYLTFLNVHPFLDCNYYLSPRFSSEYFVSQMYNTAS